MDHKKEAIKRYIEPTSKPIARLLPKLLQEIAKTNSCQVEELYAAWFAVIGEKLASMTEPVAFMRGILTIKVKNSSLYSLLAQQEKKRLLLELRKRCPRVQLYNIAFRMG